jgi:hypothetical protein
MCVGRGVNRVTQRGDHLIHQRAGLTRRGVPVIDEAQLQLLPPIPKPCGRVAVKQREARLVRHVAW